MAIKWAICYRICYSCYLHFESPKSSESDVPVSSGCTPLASLAPASWPSVDPAGAVPNDDTRTWGVHLPNKTVFLHSCFTRCLNHQEVGFNICYFEKEKLTLNQQGSRFYHQTP
jgi:hypothetical protein